MHGIVLRRHEHEQRVAECYPLVRCQVRCQSMNWPTCDVPNESQCGPFWFFA
jgi:hypothetical protein